jgi:hypothetical protein
MSKNLSGEISGYIHIPFRVYNKNKQGLTNNLRSIELRDIINIPIIIGHIILERINA